MLSRVADSIFWMARYMERTNGMLRMLRTNYVASQSEQTGFSWRSVLQTYGDLEPEQLDTIHFSAKKVMAHLLHDREHIGSVLNMITLARENARSVQDHITKEVWQCLNEYYHLARDPHIESNIKSGDPLTALDALIRHGMLYHGTVDITMARGEGFNYLNIGKYLERAILSADMVNIKLNEMNYDLHQPAEAPQWRYLLYSLSGYELYLKTYRGALQPDTVLKQVMYNTAFPHSVLYCLKQLNRYFERLKSESLPESYNRLEFLIGRGMNNVKYSNLQNKDGESLKNFLSQTRNELFEISGSFSQYYFGNS
ncbi:MAG: alpha-E domain-containing protein [Ferruginibacter sp.]